MEHKAIRDGQIIERYLLHRLDEETRDAFEAHLLYCAACREETESAERFASGMAAAPGLGDRRGTPRWLLPLAACLVAGLCLSLWHARRLDQALHEARRAVPVASGPVGNALVVPLSPVRGAATEPTAVIDLAAAGSLVVLGLEVTLPAPTYRVRLLQNTDRVLWEDADVHPDYQDSLQIAIPTAWLQVGRYRLEATAPDREPSVFTVEVVQTAVP